MSFFNESILLYLVKVLGVLFRALSNKQALLFAGIIGRGLCFFMPKKVAVVEANLRIALSDAYSNKEISTLTHKVFENFTCSFVDLLRLPRIKAEGYEKTVVIEGKENIDQALAKGRGCIFLAIHSGSWELASLVGSMCEHPYNIVANEQQKTPRLNNLLNEYRRLAGAKVIPPGSATREIIRALHANEIISLVLDQGGKDGVVVDFLGKTASMSTGAIRLGLKYGAPICPVWIERQRLGNHVLRVYPSIDLELSKDTEKDVVRNTQSAVRFFESLLRKNPSEYMWFYKVYKYTNVTDVLILDDGKTGHLRQSQAAADILKEVVEKTGKSVRSKQVLVDYKNVWFKNFLNIYCFISQAIPFLRRDSVLSFCLTESCYKQLNQVKPDYIISCGSPLAAVSFVMSRVWSVKTIHVLKPGLLDMGRFSLVVLPEHDKKIRQWPHRVVYTRAALNVITSESLKDHQEKLLSRFHHLRGNVRSKIGVLIGGDTKGVVFDPQQVRFLIRQLKDAARYFNMDLVVTTSRRTSKIVDEVINKELRGFDRCALLIIANDSNVPEAVGGILAISDLLVVSGESISMISEALSSGKRTIVFSPNSSYSGQASNKYDSFVQQLNEQGYVWACSIKDISTTIKQSMNQKVSVKPLNDRDLLKSAMEGLV